MRNLNSDDGGDGEDSELYHQKTRSMCDNLEESIVSEKMQKRSHSVNENEDRLSDLPECIILHILSFLNTKQAVQSCVLSTRWKNLWKPISTLILRSSRFKTVRKFATFVSNILTLRDTSAALHALDLERRHDIEPQLLKKILNYVCSHSTHLRQLGISVCGDTSLILSRVSFCQALTSLKLSLYPTSRGNFPKTLFPKSLNLPLLTTLDLSNFSFCGNENGCADPFSTFTKLNSLALCSCNIVDAQLLSISSEILVNLTMDYNSFDSVQIKLSTPNLCTFNFTGNLIQGISGSGLSSVKKVNIDSLNSSASMERSALVLLDWLLVFSNVESLKVTSTDLQMLSLVPDLLEVKLPTLCNLKSLEVKLIPLRDRGLLQLMKDDTLKKAAAKLPKEVAKLRKEFKARLKSHPIPDEIVDFLRQNSPSAEVNITTDFPTCFNLKQVEESIKGAKIIKYRSQISAPASPSVAPASDAAPSSVAKPATDAPPNLHLSP